MRHTVAHASCVQPGDRGGHPNQAEGSPSAQLGDRGGGGHPPSSNVFFQRTDCSRGREEDPPARKGRGGYPLSSNARSSRNTCRK